GVARNFVRSSRPQAAGENFLATTAPASPPQIFPVGVGSPCPHVRYPLDLVRRIPARLSDSRLRTFRPLLSVGCCSLLAPRLAIAPQTQSHNRRASARGRFPAARAGRSHVVHSRAQDLWFARPAKREARDLPTLHRWHLAVPRSAPRLVANRPATPLTNSAAAILRYRNLAKPTPLLAQRRVPGTRQRQTP